MSKIIRAATFYAPVAEQQPNVRIQELELRELQDDECLVEIVASGICHTDLGVAVNPKQHFPRVLGHEGSGYLRKLGKGSKASRPELGLGDPVVLSIAFCSACPSCVSGHPAYCYKAAELNFNTMTEKDFRIVGTESNGTSAYVKGGFFGQSSLASSAIVHHSCVISLKGVVKDDEELKLFAPLGCGFQTGAGTVIQLGRATASDTVAILGLGGVGLAAVMAAKIVGCDRIIAIDRIPHRLEMAVSLGATHTINCEDLNGTSRTLVDAIRKHTNNLGSSLTIDTTGVLTVIHEALEATAVRGRMVLLGMSHQQISIDITRFKVAYFLADTGCEQAGKMLLGSVQGDVLPNEFVLKLIEWYRRGQFPLEKLVTSYSADKLPQAIADMRTGDTIKPIILWQNSLA